MLYALIIVIWQGRCAPDSFTVCDAYMTPEIQRPILTFTSAKKCVAVMDRLDIKANVGGVMDTQCVRIPPAIPMPRRKRP